MRRRRTVTVAIVVLAFASLAGLPGCGDDTRPGRVGIERPRDRPRSGSDRQPGPTDPADASTYVGLTKRAAIARADAAGVPWRVTREDDEEFAVTQDYNPERVNFEIDDGRVTSATFG